MERADIDITPVSLAPTLDRILPLMSRSWPYLSAVAVVGVLAGTAIAGRPVARDEFVISPDQIPTTTAVTDDPGAPLATVPASSTTTASTATASTAAPTTTSTDGTETDATDASIPDTAPTDVSTETTG